MRYLMITFGLLAAMGGTMLLVVGATKGPQLYVWVGISAVTQAAVFFWGASVSAHLEALRADGGSRLRATTGGDVRRKFASR